MSCWLIIQRRRNNDGKEVYCSPYVADRASAQNPCSRTETIGDVKEAEQEAKKLALKHWKQYTVLSVDATFKPEKLAKKEN